MACQIESQRVCLGQSFSSFLFSQCYLNTIILFKMSVKLTCSFESQRVPRQKMGLCQKQLEQLFFEEPKRSSPDNR